MIGKPRPDLLTLFTTFYDLSVSSNVFKGRTAQIWCQWEPTFMRLSGTDDLISKPDLWTVFCASSIVIAASYRKFEIQPNPKIGFKGFNHPDSGSTDPTAHCFIFQASKSWKNRGNETIGGGLKQLEEIGIFFTGLFPLKSFHCKNETNGRNRGFLAFF